MKAFIVEDEPGAREALIADLRAYCPEVEVIGHAESVAEAEKLIRQLQPQLLFLDIQLEDGTGFDLLRKFPDPDFRIIFTTGMDQFAIRAFRVSAVDYLLKPVDPDLLEQAVAKATAKHSAPGGLNSLLQNLQQESLKKQKLVLNTQEKVHLVRVEEIIRCESHSNYTLIILSSGEHILVTKTLKEFDELLTPAGFFRVHHGHLVNLEHLKEFSRKDGGYAVMDNGDEVPVSSRKREQFLKSLMQLHM